MAPGNIWREERPSHTFNQHPRRSYNVRPSPLRHLWTPPAARPTLIGYGQGGLVPSLVGIGFASGARTPCLCRATEDKVWPARPCLAGVRCPSADCTTCSTNSATRSYSPSDRTRSVDAPVGMESDRTASSSAGERLKAFVPGNRNVFIDQQKRLAWGKGARTAEHRGVAYSAPAGCRMQLQQKNCCLRMTADMQASNDLGRRRGCAALENPPSKATARQR